MAVRESADVERPDHTAAPTGAAGQQLNQESDTSKQVVRSGASAADADFDIIKDSDGTLWDLNSDGDFNIPGDTPASRTDNPDVGGTTRMAGAVVSTDDSAFDFTIQWRDENGTLLISQTWSSSQNARFTSNHAVQFDEVVVRGDLFSVVITDTSGGQNRIRGTLNFHT